MTLPAIVVVREHREQRARAEVGATNATLALREHERAREARAYQACLDQAETAEASLYASAQSGRLSAGQWCAQLCYVERLNAAARAQQAMLRRAIASVVAAAAQWRAAQDRHRRASIKLAAAVELREQIERESARRVLMREELRAEDPAQLMHAAQQASIASQLAL